MFIEQKIHSMLLQNSDKEKVEKMFHEIAAIFENYHANNADQYMVVTSLLASLTEQTTYGQYILRTVYKMVLSITEKGQEEAEKEAIMEVLMALKEAIKSAKADMNDEPNKSAEGKSND